jgi:dTDP-glucose pyrophosphorylase
MRAPVDAALDPAQRQAADDGPKAMIPVGGLPRHSGEAATAGRPFLDHVLHALAEAGIRRVGLVLGPEHEPVRAYYRGLRLTRLTIEFVMQPEPLGTADAVWHARDWAGARPFLVLNADNLYPADVLARLAAAAGPAVPAFEADSLALPPARLGAFGLIEMDKRGGLARVIEKPGADAVAAAGPHAPTSMDPRRFAARIFPACRDVPVSARGERELPQAVSLATASGVRFDVFPARGPVLDLSTRADIATATRQLAHAPVAL